MSGGADRIRKVESFRCDIRLPQPVEVGATQVTSRDYVLTRITTEQGLEGVGFCFGRRLPLAEIVTSSFTPTLLGSDTLEFRTVPDRLRAEFWPYAEGPLFGVAVSMVEMALWDIAAKRRGVPLADLLGRRRSRVPMMAVANYAGLGEGDDVGSLREEVREYRERGFGAVKLVVGIRTPEADARRFIAAREELGPDFPIAIDAHRSYADLDEALHRLRLMADHVIEFVEDPMIESLEPALKRLRQRAGIGLALGECLWSPREFRRTFETGDIDVARLDATIVGGVSSFLEVAAMADAYGLRISPHTHPELHVHLGAVIGNLHRVGIEYIDPKFGVDAFFRLLATPLEIEDGYALIPSRPGIGLDIDWAAVEEFSR